LRAAPALLPGVLLCAGLALCGEALVGAAQLPLPGPVLGLLVYLAWLLVGRGIGWSRSGAALLLRWIGAMIVPALVSLALIAGRIAPVLLPLALVMLASTLITAVATALIYRVAGGRG
jgi:holin-like protein